MADIARLAGASISTVSRALNGSPLIPEATRQRIIDIAQACNYQINAGAANLRKRDIQTIGVAILGDRQQPISDPFILHILGAVADALDERGRNLLLTRLDASKLGWVSAMYHGGQVAGMIVIGQATLHRQLNALADQGIPMAVWGASLPGAHYGVVGGDNRAGGHQATQHLLAQGCRRIAFFGDTEHPEANQRHQGYLKAHKEAGLAPDPQLFQPYLFGGERIQAAVDGWLAAGSMPDGVFAASDMTAIAVLAALKARGLDVPAQVKVVGYDDSAVAAHVHPPLTTVRQDTATAGQELVKLVCEAIEGLAVRRVVLPAELVLRQSSGA